MDNLQFTDDEYPSVLEEKIPEKFTTKIAGSMGNPGRDGLFKDADTNISQHNVLAFQSRETNLQEQQARLSGPVQFVLKLLGYWNLSTEDAAGLLGFEAENSKYLARILEGKERFHGRDVKERISNLFFIRSSLRSLFRDLNTENEWLRDRHAFLEEKAPLSMLLEGSPLNVLAVRDYVDTVTRR